MRKYRYIVFCLICLVLTNFAQEKVKLELNLVSKNLPFGLTANVSNYSPRISLALSGGGARGITTLGILKAFEENHLEFSEIVGTSMGSIIGGLYASGYKVDELDSIIINAPWDDFFSYSETKRNELFVDQKITEDRAILALRVDGFKPVIPTALNTGQRVSSFLNMLSLNAPVKCNGSFDHLWIPFKAISTNLINGDKVIISSGSLGMAMRASSSVSLVLEPVKKDSMLLVDGGLVANVPVETAKENSDFVIAVNTTSPLRTEDELTFPWEIADQLVSIPMKKINDEQLSNADLVITPDIPTIKNNDFTNLDSLIQIGYSAGKKRIAEIKEIEKDLFIKNIPGNIETYTNIFVESNDKALESYLHDITRKHDTISNKDIIYYVSKYRRLNDYKNMDVSIQVNSSAVKLNVEVEKNPKIESVIFKGITILDSTTLNRMNRKLINQPYNSDKVLDVVFNILKLYRQKGYSLIDVNDISFNEESNELVIDISEGKIDQIRAIEMKKHIIRLLFGNFLLMKVIILRIMKLKKAWLTCGVADCLNPQN